MGHFPSHNIHPALARAAAEGCAKLSENALKCANLHATSAVGKTNPITAQPGAVMQQGGSASNGGTNPPMVQNARKCANLSAPAPSVETNPTGAATRRRLTPPQQMAAALRLRGQTVGEVAAALHVAPSTVRRWEADERFQQEIDRQLALLPRIVPNAPAGRLGVAKGSAATAPDPATFARRQASVPHREAPQKPHNSSKDDHLEDLECEALIEAILSRR